MTPQERQLVADLFERLASLEGERRDGDAERLIREGLGRAPNAVYALVQSVLIQDEALKRASARIEELERLSTGAGESTQGGGGFLDSMRNILTGQPRGSVPTVRAGGQGSSGVWGTRPDAAQPGYPPAGSPPGGYPGGGYAPGAAPGGAFGGGSFLGTAAASAAGVIGGAMLLNGIRSMFGGHQAFGDYDRVVTADAPSHLGSPWDSGGDRGGGDLSRDAGVDDIGGHRAGAYEDPGRGSFFGGGNDDPGYDDASNTDYGDGGNDDTV